MSAKLQIFGANVKSCLIGALRMVAKKDNEAHSKPLFKRKKGLSKFYANKAQSFSSLDHALSTCMGHSALALEKPKPRSYDASPLSDVDVEVTSRALHRLHRSGPENGVMERHDSMTSALCTVLELSSLSNCESDNTSVTVDSDANMARTRTSFESSRPLQPGLDRNSCPLPRLSSDMSLDFVTARRTPPSEDHSEEMSDQTVHSKSACV